MLTVYEKPPRGVSHGGFFRCTLQRGDTARKPVGGHFQLGAWADDIAGKTDLVELQESGT